MAKTLTLLVIICLVPLGWMALRAEKERQAAQTALMEAKKHQEAILRLQEEMRNGPDVPGDLEAQIERLEAQTQPLHRLRNEVNQLRGQTNQLADLRVEHEQLTQAHETALRTGKLAAEEFGFVAASTWRDVGHATPEDAIRTLFHALRAGNIELLVERTHPDNLAAQKRPFVDIPEDRREQVKESMKAFFGQLDAFRIQSLDYASESQLTAQVLTSIEGRPLPIKLHEHDGRWLFDMEDSLF